MPKNDHEVFEYFVSDPQTEYLDYVAYAIYIHHKHAWLDHFSSRNERVPSDAEIETWVSNLTDQQLVGFIDHASELFDDAARAYLADELATAQDQAFQTELLTSVKKGLSLRRQLGLALLTAIVSPIILGLLLAAIANYEKWPSVLRLFSG